MHEVVLCAELLKAPQERHRTIILFACISTRSFVDATSSSALDGQ